MKNEKLYKVFDKTKGEYVNLTYNGKTMWKVFPSQAIKEKTRHMNSRQKQEFHDGHEVHEFQIVRGENKFSLDKKLIR